VLGLFPFFVECDCMLTISDAFERLLASVAPLEPVLLPLADSLGLILAEDVAAADDSPPFDKSLMDGYAVRSADLTAGSTTLLVVDVITAGKVPTTAVHSGQAIQIMTGAPLPEGADAVIKVEETVRNGDQVTVRSQSTAAGQNILRRGTSVRRGETVLRAGLKLNGARIGALAEVGRDKVRVHPRPRVAVLATGDELVRVDQQPGPGQIRNSNESMLVAQIQSAGAIAVPLGIARDNREDLRARIASGLQCDVLVLSGGVSAGTLDLVPGELTAAGVREVFHKVEMKPGKPVWFGLRQQDRAVNYVFGLPGNPVSSMVCCELFVRTALRRLMGESDCRPQPVMAALEHDYVGRADRPTYHPARLTWLPTGPAVSLVRWHGSSDLCGTVAANAMVFLSGDARTYATGDRLEVYAW
jgi:molybdopterin molybdotransferase